MDVRFQSSRRFATKEDDCAPPPILIRAKVYYDMSLLKVYLDNMLKVLEIIDLPSGFLFQAKYFLLKSTISLQSL